jgi:hypothetical protein
MGTLQPRRDEFKKSFEPGTPPYVAPRGALKVRDLALEFSSFNRDHAPANSSELLAQGAVIVSFFRGRL